MSKNTVLITGASSGLGVFLAMEFEKRGHEVIRHGGKKDYDLSLVEETKSLANFAIENGVKILVNNAAIGCPSVLLQEYNTEQIESMLNVNLRAPILLSYFLLPYIKNIININSMVGLEIKKPRTLYSATKWGLRGFSNSLKCENKKLKILDVYPTNIKTTSGRTNAMDPYEVTRKIYDSFKNGEERLVLDGRLK